MPEGATIAVEGLTKRFGAVEAVSGLSFTVRPGVVTGFLGPNGAGKTTTLRMLLGLVRPTEGTATFDGVAYHRLEHPLVTVGSALEAASFHPGRTAADHLRVHAIAAGIPQARVGVVLGTVGLTEYAHRRVGGYSLGMRQRLGLAFALLGDPGVLVLDEPVNGLDPEGIKWIRMLLQSLAEEGRTVLISSHLLSEVQQSVDEVVVITRGRLAHAGTLTSLESGQARRVLVDADDRAALASALDAGGFAHSALRGGLLVEDAETSEIGRLAFAAGIPVTALHQRRSGLEESFLALVGPDAPADGDAAPPVTEGRP